MTVGSKVFEACSQWIILIGYADANVAQKEPNEESYGSLTGLIPSAASAVLTAVILGEARRRDWHQECKGRSNKDMPFCDHETF